MPRQKKPSNIGEAAIKKDTSLTAVASPKKNWGFISPNTSDDRKDLVNTNRPKRHYSRSAGSSHHTRDKGQGLTKKGSNTPEDIHDREGINHTHHLFSEEKGRKDSWGEKVNPCHS